jgi:hypothetical protein
VVETPLNYQNSQFLDNMTINHMKSMEKTLNGMFARQFPHAPEFQATENHFKAAWGIYRQGSKDPFHCEPASHNNEAFRIFKNMPYEQRESEAYKLGYVVLIPLHEEGLPVRLIDWSGGDAKPIYISFTVPFGSLVCIRSDIYFNTGYGHSENNFHLRVFLVGPDTPWPSEPAHSTCPLTETTYPSAPRKWTTGPKSMKKKPPKTTKAPQHGTSYMNNFRESMRGMPFMDEAMAILGDSSKQRNNESYLANFKVDDDCVITNI